MLSQLIQGIRKLSKLQFAQTGDDRYKDLENGIFVGQGHFITKTGEKPVVEYKVSQVISG